MDLLEETDKMQLIGFVQQARRLKYAAAKRKNESDLIWLSALCDVIIQEGDRGSDSYKLFLREAIEEIIN